MTTLYTFSKEAFFLESAFAKVRNSGLQGCRIREKGTVSQIFLWKFQNFKHPFLSEHFQNASVVQSSSRLQTVLVQLHKRELHYICFSNNFLKFLVQLLQNTLKKSFVKEFSRVLGCRLQPCIILKSDSNRDNFQTCSETESEKQSSSKAFC